ncbi:5-oxoprolinase subunit PxpA [Ruania halotolerans]|uniref:5-oxoprolinase subunit PxpA n=1 Tax=Ruania halotolerans TaxID=2897773 RepID=UPI001E31006B|nr:5-oxoprolinase subunit PxpA [Ruania halotolerans]UFU07712.1 LamB/YcsF family protein [Ruania halotolerans]
MRSGTLDLNADLGEGVGDDAAMLSVVTSANIACGGHAGDADTMAATCAVALTHGVRIGAHPAYPDRENFGRAPVVISEAVLTNELRTQVRALIEEASAVGAQVTYLKPHGALYHAATRDPEHARAVVTTAAEAGLAVVGPPGSLLLDLAGRAGLGAVPEAFADRAYTSDGGLVPREQPGAVLHDPIVIAERVMQLLRTGTMIADDGTSVSLDIRTLCVHGDTPGAVAIATHVRAALDRAGLSPVSFT